MAISDVLDPPDGGDDWFALSSAPLPVGAATDWAIRPDCGGIVSFVGTARDHSEGRPDVRRLEYEAYDEQVVPRLERVAAEARARWTDRRAHRPAAPHRSSRSRRRRGRRGRRRLRTVTRRSQAARFCIDTLKATGAHLEEGGLGHGRELGARVPAPGRARTGRVAGAGADAVTAFLIFLVVAVVAGVAVVALRVRPQGSIESGISSFRREMRALAPPGQRRPGPGRDPGGTSDEPPAPGSHGDGPVPGAG